MNRLLTGDVQGPELFQRAFWMSFGLLFLIPVAVAVTGYEEPGSGWAGRPWSSSW